MANIKKITLDGTSYDVYDEYCRRRLAGAGTVYSIDNTVTPSSTYTYIDIISGATVSMTSALNGNDAFKGTGEDITVAITKYLILLNSPATNQYYVVKVGDLTIGDSVFVKQKNVPDRWISAKDTTNGTFSKLEEKIDLSDYAKKVDAAKAGTYTSSAPSTNTTGSAGGETITSSEEAGYTATGTASVTYKKSDTATGSAGAGASANTGDGGAVTVSGANFSFTGTTATISISGDVTGTTVSDHEYTPAGTIGGSQAISGHTHSATLTTASVSYIKSVASATGSDGAHTHDVASHEHATDVSAITAFPNFSGGSASGTFVTGVKTAGSASLTGTTKFVTSAIGTASLGGTQTFNTNAYKASYDSSSESLVLTAASTGTVTISTTAAATASVGISHSDPTFNTGSVSWTAASLGNPTTATVAGATSAKTLTAVSAGGHTHSIASTAGSFNNVTAVSIGSAGGVTVSGANFTFTGTAATLSHTVTQGSFSGETTYKPAGSIDGSQSIAAHKHSYTAPSAHTHSIGLTDTTASGSATAAITAHTHTVTITAHTHTMGNHTHSTTIPNCN